MTERSKMRALLTRAEDRPVRLIGASDGLSALIASRAGFDGLWASGFAISTAHGVPDASILSMTEFLSATEVMSRATTLPIVADCDTGFGDIHTVARMVRLYERAGVAGVCLEDKPFPKRNSYLDGNAALESPLAFASKILTAKKAQRDPDFVVIARLESLICGYGMDDAIERACLYADAGADAILIHSKAQTPHEVFEFAARWKSEGVRKPLVAVPTTYAEASAGELHDGGIDVVIYANHAIRAATYAVERVLAQIATDSTTMHVERELASMNDIFELVGANALGEREERTHLEAGELSARRLAAHRHAD